MAKYQYAPPQVIPIQTNATTASPNLVRAITLDATYEARTVQVVLTREDGKLNMSVYRASTSRHALGNAEREDFVHTPEGLKRLGNADVKFLRHEVPTGAKRKVIQNVEVFTMTEMSDEEERQLRADLVEMLRG